MALKAQFAGRLAGHRPLTEPQFAVVGDGSVVIGLRRNRRKALDPPDQPAVLEARIAGQDGLGLESPRHQFLTGDLEAGEHGPVGHIYGAGALIGRLDGDHALG